MTQVFHTLGVKKQTKAYGDCARRALEGGHEWEAFFDVDELLILRKHQDVVTFIQEYCAVGALGVNWRYFGTSDETEYRPLPVTKRFTLRQGEVNQHFKSIARLAGVYGVGHTHYVQQLKKLILQIPSVKDFMAFTTRAGLILPYCIIM